MPVVEMIMPKMGESVMEGTILKWLKKLGDKVREEECIAEVATDKVTTEIPCEHGGRLTKILVAAGEIAKIGQPIALIETDAKQEEISAVPARQEKQVGLSASAVVSPAQQGAKDDIPTRDGAGNFYSPLVRKIAKEHGVSLQVLQSLSGTGMHGRVTKADLLRYLDLGEKSTTQPAAPQDNPSPPTMQPLGTSVQPGDEIIEMSHMRRLIAERMIGSQRTAAHVTSFVEADVTALVAWKKKYAKNLYKETKQALTLTPLFLEAVIKAIKDYPMVNSRIVGDKIIRQQAINIGLAVSLPSNDLVVPVIKHAQHLSLQGLTEQVNSLASRAKNGKLLPEDLEGGTFTVSNIGTFGNLMGTPIILQPQSAILALGCVHKKPVVIESPQGDCIGIRQMMYLSHSYDHRIIDGVLGGSFAKRVAEYMETFDTTRTMRRPQQESTSPS